MRNLIASVPELQQKLIASLRSDFPIHPNATVLQSAAQRDRTTARAWRAMYRQAA